MPEAPQPACSNDLQLLRGQKALCKVLGAFTKHQDGTCHATQIIGNQGLLRSDNIALCY